MCPDVRADLLHIVVIARHQNTLGDHSLRRASFNSSGPSADIEAYDRADLSPCRPSRPASAGSQG